MTTTENSSNPASDTTPEFIAIGDMVIDAFIRLNDQTRAHVTKHNDGSKEIFLPFGDKVEFEFAEEIVAVGNSANAAVSAARLGASAGLVVNIGADENGAKCLAQLEKEGISTTHVTRHKGKKTNYHYVLWFQDERTILIKHEEYEYTFPLGNTTSTSVAGSCGPDSSIVVTTPNYSQTQPQVAPKFLYLSSVSENALPFHTLIADYLDQHPETKLVFQPGTFQMKWGTEKLTRIYRHSELFFCNVEEAQRILQIESRDIKTLLAGLRRLGPILPIITDGPGGVSTYNSKSSAAGTDSVASTESILGATGKHEINYDEIVHLDIYPDIAPPYERTGAGDAFASTFSVAYMKGHSIIDALKWGSINSMNVCQHIGAQAGLLTHEKIEEYLKNAPAGWDAKIL